MIIDIIIIVVIVLVPGFNEYVVVVFESFSVFFN